MRKDWKNMDLFSLEKRLREDLVCLQIPEGDNKEDSDVKWLNMRHVTIYGPILSLESHDKCRVCQGPRRARITNVSFPLLCPARNLLGQND